jgi:aminoglycoside phosphotransferase (APT) family kinase protein
MFDDQLPPEIIPVRKDERFNEAAVELYLRDRLPGADQPLSVSQFGGGAANLTYLLDYGSHEYVLRRPPLGPVARSAHDMKREYSVLSVLHRAFPYAPHAYLYYPNNDLIGSDFLVMDRKHGVVVRRRLPPEFAAIPHAPRQMSLAMVDTLVEFHAVDYEALGLSDLGRPDGFVSRQIEGWYRRWKAALVEELPEMDACYYWLRQNQPQRARRTLVHNDYKLDNVMLSATDPGQMVAIFDWDMCTLGDPLCDLGALLAYWTEPDDPPHFKGMASMPLGVDGFLSRQELVARYAESSGESLEDIHFYYALALYRLAVILAQIYIRYKRGQTKDSRFARLGEVTPLVARAAQDVAEGRVSI